MAHLTEKENYLMCLRGEQPEWIPHVTMDPERPGLWKAAEGGWQPLPVDVTHVVHFHQE